MPGTRILKILFLSWLLAIPAALSSQEVVYLEAGSGWSWLPGLSEASAPREAWRESAFDDSAWASGAAPCPAATVGIMETRKNLVIYVCGAERFK